MVIIFLGPPAVGKGTQSKRLISFLAAHHLSTGDMLRVVREEPTELGRRVTSLMDSGQLVSDDIVVDVVKERLAVLDISPASSLLFDGFPRTAHQAEALDEMLSQKGLQVDHVIQLTVPTEVLVERARRRGQEENRSDDDEATVVKRMQVYRERTQPLVSYYRQRDLVRAIDGVGTVDEVFDRIKSSIGAT